MCSFSPWPWLSACSSRLHHHHDQLQLKHRQSRRLPEWRGYSPLNLYQDTWLATRKTFRNVICIFNGKGAKVIVLFQRCDYDTITLHTQSAWFAMVTLQANPKLTEGLFLEISFWKNAYADTWIRYFLWIFIKLEHKGECLAKELGEMAQWSCGWQVSEFKPPSAETLAS